LAQRCGAIIAALKIAKVLPHRMKLEPMVQAARGGPSAILDVLGVSDAISLIGKAAQMLRATAF
jgi:hypothetical protein